MTSPDTAKAREYLARAEHAINTGFSDMATPLATIATAYAVLASTPYPTTVQIRPIKVDPTELAQSIRAAQAIEEARPHDGEQSPGEAAHWLEGDDEVFTEADRG